MLLDIDNNLKELWDDYMLLKKNKEISLRSKCILLRALFEQYMYHILLTTNLINACVKCAKSCADDYNEYKNKEKNWKPEMYQEWVNIRLKDEFKILWGNTNYSINKVIQKGLLSLDKVATKKMTLFYNDYYKNFLVNAHHRKVFKINQIQFNKLTNEIDDLLGNVLLNSWLISKIEIIISNSLQGRSHIEQNGSIVCPGKSPDSKYSIKTASIKCSISYLLLAILATESKSTIIKISDGQNTANLCRLCIMRILGKTETKTYLSLPKLKEIIKENRHVMNKL